MTLFFMLINNFWQTASSVAGGLVSSKENLIAGEIIVFNNVLKPFCGRENENFQNNAALLL